MRRPAVLVLLLFLTALPALAKEDVPAVPEPVSPEEAAEDVLVADAEDDEKALAALAARDEPDPWLVADVLQALGRQDAALRFAHAGKGPAVELLPKYLETSVRHRGIEAARAQLARAREALAAGVKPALDALGKVQSQRAHVAGVRIASLRGELLGRAGRHAEAALAYERAAERAEVIGWQVQMAESLYKAGTRHYYASEYNEALALFQRRLAVERKLGSGFGQARTHHGISLAHNVLGHVDDEARHRNLARTLAKEHGDIEYLARVIASDARVAHLAGESRRALELFDQAEALIETLDPAAVPARFRPDPVRVAKARAGRLGNSASMAMALGEDSRAREYARRAVAFAQSVDDPDVLEDSRAFLSLLEGVVHLRAGRHLEALSHFDRAKGRYKRLGFRDEYASVLRRSARVREALGDHPAAIAAIEEALGILKETGHKRESCHAHLEAGTICGALGRGEEARSHFEEAHRLAIQLRDKQLEMNALGHLADVHKNRVEYGEAVDLLNDALKIHEANPDSTDAGNIYIRLGNIYRALGDLKRAHAYIEAAIRSYEAGGQGDALTAARRNKTYILVEEGRHEEALALLEELTRVYEERANRQQAAGAMKERAKLLLAHGDRPEWEEATRLLTKVIGLHVASGNRGGEIMARVQLSRAQVWTDAKDKALDEATWALDLAEEFGQMAHRAWALAGLTQVHVMRGENGPAVKRAEQGAELIRNYGLDLAEGERAVVRGVFHSIHIWGLLAALRGGNTGAAYRFLEQGRAAGLVASLGGRKAVREAQVPRSLRDAEEIANGRAAVAYAEYQRAKKGGTLKAVRERKEELEEARQQQQDAVAAIQRATRAQADLSYPEPAELADVQASLGEGDAFVMYGWDGWDHVALVITRKSTRAVTLPELEKERDALDAMVAGEASAADIASVRKLIIEPLALKKSTRRLLISPISHFAYVPFSLLEPDREVCFVPSATTFQLLRTIKVAAGDKVLALGDPVYDARSNSAGDAAILRGRELTPLPATRKEATAVGDIVLLGKEASETRFREVLPTRKHWRAVHLACHGLVDPALPARSALVLTRDAKNDGFLRAGELFSQVPVPADLVVLSACETALGRVYSGEGLVGLTRAFMLAGTPRVLASLWKVDDAATQALMLKFYELWNPAPKEPALSEPGESKGRARTGMSAAAALKAAQAFVRGHEKWKAPKYWAAWVLWGLPD